MKNKLLIIITAFILLHTNMNGQPIGINVSGGPSFVSSQVNIIEAGNDFANNRIESSSQSYISIFPSNYWTAILKNFRYRTTVYKSDIHMHPELNLEIIRVGPGVGLSYAKVYDGENWQSVKNTPAYFFSGKGTRYNIPVNYRITNISVLIPADDYETTVIYTVYEE